MRFLAFLCLFVPLIAGAADLSKAQRAAIEDRIKPFSEVCVAGDSACGAVTCRLPRLRHFPVQQSTLPAVRVMVQRDKVVWVPCLQGRASTISLVD